MTLSAEGYEIDESESSVPRSRSARYRMSTQLASLGTDFLVLNGAGDHVLRIDGYLISEEDTVCVEDIEGRVLYRAVAHLARQMDRLAIVDAQNVEVCAIVRTQVSPLRDLFAIEFPGGHELKVEGNVALHEFFISGPDGRIAEVSRRWFRARDSYGIEITPSQQDALLVTAIVAMNLMVNGTN